MLGIGGFLGRGGRCGLRGSGRIRRVGACFALACVLDLVAPVLAAVAGLPWEEETWNLPFCRWGSRDE